MAPHDEHPWRESEVPHAQEARCESDVERPRDERTIDFCARLAARQRRRAHASAPLPKLPPSAA